MMQFVWLDRPNVNFFCDTDYDPFLFLEENDKVYGESRPLALRCSNLNTSRWKASPSRRMNGH